MEEVWCTVRKLGVSSLPAQFYETGQNFET